MQEDPILIYDPKISKSSQFSPEINFIFPSTFHLAKKLMELTINESSSNDESISS